MMTTDVLATYFIVYAPPPYLACPFALPYWAAGLCGDSTQLFFITTININISMTITGILNLQYYQYQDNVGI